MNLFKLDGFYHFSHVSARMILRFNLILDFMANNQRKKKKFLLFDFNRNSEACELNMYNNKRGSKNSFQSIKKSSE